MHYVYRTTLTCPELQMDEWSGDENASPSHSNRKEPISEQSQLRRAHLHIRLLKEQLAATQKDLVDYRNFVNDNITNIAAETLGTIQLEEIRNEQLPPPGPRDDDTHYFESYDDQGRFIIIFFFGSIFIVFSGQPYTGQCSQTECGRPRMPPLSYQIHLSSVMRS